MNKENKVTINNLIYALLFLVVGVLLINQTEDLLTIISKVIGSILIIIGIVKAIIYIYMKGKLGDYNISDLAMGISLICFGVILILFSSALSFTIRILLGLWVLFAGINKIIFAITIRSVNNKSFLVYLITSFLITILGLILISGLFDQIIGVLIIIYSVIEVFNYIYFKVNDNKETIVKESVKSSKKNNKVKRLKKGKVVDAVIEEDYKK